MPSSLKFQFLFMVLFSLVQTADLILNCNVTASQGSSQIIKGKNFVFCIHFIDTNNQTQRAAFQVTIDEYTGLELISPPINTEQDAYLYLQAQNNATYNTTLFYSFQSKQIAKLFSFVLYVQNGELQIIEDDNDPFYNSCESGREFVINEVTRRNCFFANGTGIELSKIGDNSNPKILLSWMGTDKNGEYLLSHTQRVSKFKQYSISDVFQSAYNIF